MKKTYIIPEALTVSLNTSTIIAASPNNINISGTTGTANFINEEPTGEVLTKESVNVWDEEW